MQDKGAEDRPEKAALQSGYWSRGLETEAGAMGLAGEARSRQREPHVGGHRGESCRTRWRTQRGSRPLALTALQSGITKRLGAAFTGWICPRAKKDNRVNFTLEWFLEKKLGSGSDLRSRLFH